MCVVLLLMILDMLVGYMEKMVVLKDHWSGIILPIGLVFNREILIYVGSVLKPLKE